MMVVRGGISIRKCPRLCTDNYFSPVTTIKIPQRELGDFSFVRNEPRGHVLSGICRSEQCSTSSNTGVFSRSTPKGKTCHKAHLERGSIEKRHANTFKLNKPLRNFKSHIAGVHGWIRWPAPGLRRSRCSLTHRNLRPKGSFEFFLAQPGSELTPDHLRTFQRRVSSWRATHGPEKEVYFPQQHSPGQAMELDWTHAKELEVTIAGVPLDHLLCHCVLPYSNWEWATRCQSESFLSLVSGLQASLGKLGKKPLYLSTDHSSAATHEISPGGGQRAFNPDYLDVCEHYDLLPVTINVACPHEHGDVESQNGHLKRRIKQHLLLRGSRDFVVVEDYDRFVVQVMEWANRPRQPRLDEELGVMKPLPATRLAEYRELDVSVSSHSTIRVKNIAYSVPSRLIGQRLRVEIYEQVLKLYLGR